MGKAEPFGGCIEQARFQARYRLVYQIVDRIDNVIYEGLGSCQRCGGSSVACCISRVTRAIRVDAELSQSTYQWCVAEVLSEQGGRRIIHCEKICFLRGGGVLTR